MYVYLENWSIYSIVNTIVEEPEDQSIMPSAQIKATENASQENDIVLEPKYVSDAIEYENTKL